MLLQTFTIHGFTDGFSSFLHGCTYMNRFKCTYIHIPHPTCSCTSDGISFWYLCKPNTFSNESSLWCWRCFTSVVSTASSSRTTYYYSDPIDTPCTKAKGFFIVYILFPTTEGFGGKMAFTPCGSIPEQDHFPCEDDLGYEMVKWDLAKL